MFACVGLFGGLYNLLIWPRPDNSSGSLVCEKFLAASPFFNNTDKAPRREEGRGEEAERRRTEGRI